MTDAARSRNSSARLTIFEETELMAAFGPDRQKGIGYVMRTIRDFAAGQA